MIFAPPLKKVAAGNEADQETKAAVEDLKTRLTENEATDAEQATAITELVNKLAASAPPEA